MGLEKIDSLLESLRQVHSVGEPAVEAASSMQDFEKRMFDAMYDVTLANGRVLKLPKSPDGEVDWKKIGSAIHNGIEQFLHDLI